MIEGSKSTACCSVTAMSCARPAENSLGRSTFVTSSTPSSSPSSPACDSGRKSPHHFRLPSGPIMYPWKASSPVGSSLGCAENGKSSSPSKSVKPMERSVPSSFSAHSNGRPVSCSAKSRRSEHTESSDDVLALSNPGVAFQSHRNHVFFVAPPCARRATRRFSHAPHHARPGRARCPCRCACT